MTKLKFCTWNIEMGNKLPVILAEMKKHPDFERLDFMALQEASEKDEFDSVLIASQLGNNYSWAQQTADFFQGKAQANGLVWNKKRITSNGHQFVNLPVYTSFNLPLPEKLFLTLMRIQKRLFLVFEGKINGLLIQIYVVHLNVWGFEYKEEQFRLVMEDMNKRSPVDLTVILGDMNTFTFQLGKIFHWRRLIKIATDAGFVDLTSEIKFTHHLRRLRLKQKLDAIFVRSKLPYTCRSWSLDAMGSDHLPVFAEITI